MKIKDLRTVMVDLPGTTWIIKPEIRTFGCLLVFLDTDEGVTGESFLWVFGTQRLPMLNSMVLSLKPDVLGEDPQLTERIWRKLWSEFRFFGVEGMSMFALSVIDRACWDARGKAAGKPVYKLLGGDREEVPTYAGGFRLPQTIDELVRDARAAVGQGYRALKMRIGKPTVEEDVERVQAVREAVGPNFGLMVDANQRFTVEHAIRLGRRFEELDVTWFEEPVPAWDLEGSARVAAALDLPVASGENAYARYGFRRMMENKAADILMPDLIRVGGITELLKVAHMAEAFDLPVTPHLFPEESMHVVASVTNATYVENMDWFSPLYKERIELRNGMIVLPQRPGFGFTFDPEVIERHRVEEK
ncbi:MAG: mandelate racemase [Deltaproteobacteria bacterium]|jgi:L-alanine-DL-glutamate epimerase-like enolase superfamily enzyme|nr:mandelate racemase [Deltaproteobacteria bacterium]